MIIIIIINPLAPLMSLMSRLEQMERPQKIQSWHDPACNMGKLIRKHNKQHEIFPPPPKKKTGIGLPACFSQATSGLAEQATRSYYPRSVVQG